MYYLTQAGVKLINEKMKRSKRDTSTSQLSTDPASFGSTTEGKPKSRPRSISVAHSKHFEPAEKMDSPESKANVGKIKTAIKSGVNMPPVVRDTSVQTRSAKVRRLVRGKGRRKYDDSTKHFGKAWQKQLISDFLSGKFIQPIHLRLLDNNTWEIIDGGHRLKAFKELGIKKIPSVTPGKVTR